ncbi:hypothetical protein KAR91_59705 [Candidatus Pacearchaeota archaeon]|nr:hypothetical protein [Candidatus Pacearchaeota archaeon]
MNGKAKTVDVPFNSRSEAIEQIPFYNAMPDVECTTIEESEVQPYG